MNPNKQNTISLEIAEKWTAEWRKRCPDNCKAFLIPAVDLIEVLNEIGILGDKAAKKAQKKANKRGADIRAYMAIGAGKAEETEEERLIIVGTKKDEEGIYRDIINGTIDGKNKVVEGEKGSSGMYDFTTPCPTACDPYSPLS